MAAYGVFSLILLGTSGLLLDSHRRTWLGMRQDDSLSDHEKRFGKSQYWRRMQASSIIGLVGVAVGVGPLVPHRPAPLVAYVILLLTACSCLIILALVDVWAIRHHYRRKQSEFDVEQLKLANQLREVQKDTSRESTRERRRRFV